MNSAFTPPQAASAATESSTDRLADALQGLQLSPPQAAVQLQRVFAARCHVGRGRPAAVVAGCCRGLGVAGPQPVADAHAFQACATARHFGAVRRQRCLQAAGASQAAAGRGARA